MENGTETNARDEKMIPARQVSPLVIFFLSLALPGVGHMVIGQRWRGSIWLAVCIVLCGLLGVLNLVCALDAWSLAKKLRDEPIGKWETHLELKMLADITQMFE